MEYPFEFPITLGTASAAIVGYCDMVAFIEPSHYDPDEWIVDGIEVWSWANTDDPSERITLRRDHRDYKEAEDWLIANRSAEIGVLFQMREPSVREREVA